jgi:hypothetical protein
MAALNPVIYLVVGLMVTIVSVIMGLNAFIYLGLIFMVWGIARLSWNKVAAKRQKRATDAPEAIVSKPTHHIQHVYCPHCGNMVKHNDNFCSRCGARRLR